jgi:hypothetical protein
LLRTQLLAKGIIDKGEWNVYKEGMDFVFSDDSYFSEIKKLEMMKERIEMVDTIGRSEMIGKYLSAEWVKKNILMQTDEDIEDMKKVMDKEKAEAPKEDDDDDNNSRF